MKTKFFLASTILALAFGTTAALSTTKIEAKPVEATNNVGTLYLNANIWDTSGAKFSCYYWNDSQSVKGFVQSFMSKVSGSVYSIELPADADNVIFVRNTNAATAPIDWNTAMWNQSIDIDLDTMGENNCYKITNWDVGDGRSGGDWEKYTYVADSTLDAGMPVYLQFTTAAKELMDNTEGGVRIAIYTWGDAAGLGEMHWVYGAYQDEGQGGLWEGVLPGTGKVSGFKFISFKADFEFPASAAEITDENFWNNEKCVYQSPDVRINENNDDKNMIVMSNATTIELAETYAPLSRAYNFAQKLLDSTNTACQEKTGISADMWNDIKSQYTYMCNDAKSAFVSASTTDETDALQNGRARYGVIISTYTTLEDFAGIKNSTGLRGMFANIDNGSAIAIIVISTSLLAIGTAAFFYFKKRRLSK